MTYTPHGKHIIAGERVAGASSFRSDPVTGEGVNVAEATAAETARAAEAAEAAFASFGGASRQERAALLNAIADRIEAAGADLTAAGTAETGLPAARLDGERGRTTGQLRMFAKHILEDGYLDIRHDPALPDRQPMARPDLRVVQRPRGPVAVFGASNFPLAFSTAGGDTASALAAGCPVVVKGHPAHPVTCEIVAEAITSAIAEKGMNPGIFSLVQGAGREAGETLVRHPLIRAVGFTGSLRGGRALFDLCASRPEPIPFFGELGSINPTFLLPEAMKSRGGAIAAGWAGSLTMGAGQFCTNPGVMVGLDGPDLDAFIATATEKLGEIAEQTMLTQGIARAYCEGRDRIAGTAGVKQHLSSACTTRGATPALFETDGATFLGNHTLSEEVFGPTGIVVRAKDTAEMKAIADGLEGQLTCTLQMDDGDIGLARTLMPILERKAGRVLANGFPTGVEVCDAMVHGGPYPASTNFGATSVGTLAIRRFVRPVCYQNLPAALLPADLAG